MDHEKIVELVKAMTLEEKAALTSGEDGWHTKAIERLNIPEIHVSDGPHGLRTITEDDQNSLGGESIPAVCFPAECGMAASFDRNLLYETGVELARESQASGVQVLLGPGVNMKRSPLCGRNFEYFSEDPYLAGEMGAAYVKGVQSQGVGTSLKHFFANNQEYRRFDSSSEMDERTMREIYLPAFEKVVKEAQPWTVMASYNQVHGVHSTANKKGLTNTLRGEWGFEGLVVSDWGATHDRPAAIEAGCDLSMPFDGTDEDILEAVKEGVLDEAALDTCCERILELVFKSLDSHREGLVLDLEAGHAASRKAAAETMVLLKNDGLLPLKKDAKAAFIGLFAEKPRFQGGGSANINAFKVVGALDAAKNEGLPVTYAQGYKEDGSTDDALLSEAVEAAKAADVAVIFAGLHDNMESEGADRLHKRMPEGHNALISAVCAANPNTVVVLHNGSPVEMPWVEEPKAILEAYLGGQAVGEAEIAVLYGDVNPSGHLAETFPKKLSDNPSFLSFHGEGNVVKYQEGVFVGYRYYTTKEMDVLFPFGHGLSYTSFAYSDLTLDKTTLKENETVTATVKVTNTGSHPGKALVQLYVAPHHVEIIRPLRELKGFEKVELQPGESKTVSIELDSRAFAHWNVTAHGCRCERGKYDIQICENANQVLLSETVELDVPALLPTGGYTEGVPMGMLAGEPKGRKFLDENIIYLVRGMVAAGYIPEQILQVADQIPGGLTLGAMEMISKRSGRGQGVGGATGLDALLGQPTSVLTGFLPKEKKKELKLLLEELNHNL